MKVYVFGDSHAGKFANNPYCHWPGSASHGTAYNLGNPKSQSRSYERLQFHLSLYDKEDVWLFVLGEIDCRIHIYLKHKQTGLPINILIDETILRYGHIIKAVRDDGRPNIAVLDVPPAVAQENLYKYEHYGTRDERAVIARKFNAALGRWCERNDIFIVRLYPYIADERGWLKDEYADEDNAHVKPSTVPYVIEQLKGRWPGLCE